MSRRCNFHFLMNKIKSQTLRESLFPIKEEIWEKVSLNLGKVKFTEAICHFISSIIPLLVRTAEYIIISELLSKGSLKNIGQSRAMSKCEVLYPLQAMSCNTLFCILGPAAIMRGRREERHKCFSFSQQLSLKN